MRARHPGRWPLAWQLACAFALVTTVALAGGGALLLERLQARQLAQRAETLLDQATVAANLVAELRRSGTPEQINLALFRFHQQTGVRPVVAAPDGVAVVVAEVLQALQPLARQRGVRLELPPPPSVRLRLDPGLVETVLGNLVENALKYTPAGGAARVELTQGDGTVRLAVHDTGPGIAPEHQGRIFERFYRVDRARSRATGGTGLGLAIATAAAARLGGRIELTSQVGAGSCFTLVLPCLPDDTAS